MSSPKIILSINAGSSSVKVSVYNANGKSQDPTELAVVQIEGLTAPPAKLKYERGDEKVKGKELVGIKSQEDAFKYIVDHLLSDKGLPELASHDDISYACHRVVHGGDYPRAQVIDSDTYHHIEKLSDLAPLHNAGALTIVQAVSHLLPNTTNIAYFDSSFHATIPKHIRTYPINQNIATHNKLRKYGFHGLSYSFIIKAVAAHLKKPVEKTNIIACHLGSGASMCVIKNGQSHDTTMGLTPLAGLPGATRSGSIDPSLIFHFTHEAGNPSRSSTKEMHITQAEEILNKKSGWSVLTGTTDFGLISRRADDGDETCQLAFDIFVDRVLGYVGSYYLKLNGDIDALVFAGGIGEKGDKLRKAVVEGAAAIGFSLDEKLNKEAGGSNDVVTEISSKDSRHKVLVCQTDEQLEMARGVVEHTEEFASGARSGGRLVF